MRVITITSWVAIMFGQNTSVSFRLQAHLSSATRFHASEAKEMSNITDAGAHLIEGHRIRKDGEELIAEGYKLLARSSDLDCDPEVRSLRIRDGYTKLAEGHKILAKSSEMIADAIAVRHVPFRPPVEAEQQNSVGTPAEPEQPKNGGKYTDTQRKEISDEAKGKKVESLEWVPDERYWAMTFNDASEICFRLMAELEN